MKVKEPSDDLDRALERLFASNEEFDDVVSTLRQHRARALPVLTGLLDHPDPGWRIRAAIALGRMHEAPGAASAGLRALLRSKDAAAKVAAISAIEWLPAAVRRRAVPAVIRLLLSKTYVKPPFTVGRANIPRIVAAHFLARFGAAEGALALHRASARRSDPVIDHIDAALRKAGRQRE